MGTTATVPVRFRLDEVLEERKESPKESLSQSELSRRSGVSLTTINAIMLNKTRQVSLDTLDKLCQVLEIAPGELLEREKKRRGR